MTADSQKTQFNGVTTQSLTYMQTTRYLKYLEDETMQMVSLPYGNGAFSMIIILPKETIDRNGRNSDRIYGRQTVRLHDLRTEFRNDTF